MDYDYTTTNYKHKTQHHTISTSQNQNTETLTNLLHPNLLYYNDEFESPPSGVCRLDHCRLLLYYY
jgi:hypothetical protein